MLALVFDTETNDMVNFKKPAEDPSQPYPVEIAWQLVNTENWSTYQSFVGLCRLPPSIDVAPGAGKVHGLDKAMLDAYGMNSSVIFQMFDAACAKADLLVAHSFDYDRRVMTSMGLRQGVPDYELKTKPSVCTMKASTKLTKLPHANGRGGYKWPTLAEAHLHFTGKEMEDSHTAMADVGACLKIFRKLVERDVINLKEVVS